MTTTTRPLTAEDLLHLPEDGARHELVRGQLIPMPPAGNRHGRRTMRLGWRLAQHVEKAEQDTLDGGEIVPGFRCPVSEIFG